MTVDFRKEKRKQKYLIYVAIIVIIITATVLWFGFFQSDGSTEFNNSPILTREIYVNFDSLNSDAFAKFKEFNKTAVFEGSVGRLNPFLPY